MFQGEDISETAVREVREETGVETEFVSLLCFRHMHALRWGTDDIYFVCLLKPLTSEVNIDQKEIAASKWVDVSFMTFTIIKGTFFDAMCMFLKVSLSTNPREKCGFLV